MEEDINDNVGIPFGLKDYLELVDWAGREIRQGKRGHIPAQAPPLLTRLGVESTPFLDYFSRIEKQSITALGPVSMLRAFAHSVGRRFVKGISLGRKKENPVATHAATGYLKLPITD